MSKPKPSRRSATHQSTTLCSGIEVHQESIAAAYIAQDRDSEVTYLGTIGSRQADLDPSVRQLRSKVGVKLKDVPPGIGTLQAIPVKDRLTGHSFRLDSQGQDETNLTQHDTLKYKGRYCDPSPVCVTGHPGRGVHAAAHGMEALSSGGV
jgi:hypothetical protein